MKIKIFLNNVYQCSTTQVAGPINQETLNKLARKIEKDGRLKENSVRCEFAE